MKSFFQGALLFALLLVALQTQAATVWVSPASQSAVAGDSVSLDLFFVHDAPVTIGSVDISYDDSRLQYGGFIANTSLILDPAATAGIDAPLVSEDPTDSAPGRVSALTIANFASGTFGGNLGSLVFTLLDSAAVGRAGVNVEASLTGFNFFSKADFDASNFTHPLAVDFSGAGAEVVVTPLPAAGWLMLSAIFLFALLSYRRRSTVVPGEAPMLAV